MTVSGWEKYFQRTCTDTHTFCVVSVVPIGSLKKSRRLKLQELELLPQKRFFGETKHMALSAKTSSTPWNMARAGTHSVTISGCELEVSSVQNVVNTKSNRCLALKCVAVGIFTMLVLRALSGRTIVARGISVGSSRSSPMDRKRPCKGCPVG